MISSEFAKVVKCAVAVVFFYSLASSAVAQNKPIVAVSNIESSFRDYDTSNIQTAIETAIVQSGKYSLMERGRLDELLAEQGKSASGLVAGSGELGGFDGIDYLIYGSVTNVSLSAKNLLLVQQCEARFAIDIRVVDVQSGEIRLTKSVSESDDVATSQNNQDPCRGVTFASLSGLADDAARDIIEAMSQALFPVKIAKVSDDLVYLNYGEGFLRNGELLKIASLGEGFLDPDTGEVLGAEETLIAIVQVEDLRAKYSIANIILQNGDLNIGDVANRLDSDDSKKLQKAVVKCNQDSTKANKACDRDSSSCERYRTAAEVSCGSLLD
jgi:curli biogenesis system outer membrane secretion channel CsgG